MVLNDVTVRQQTEGHQSTFFILSIYFQDESRHTISLERGGDANMVIRQLENLSRLIKMQQKRSRVKDQNNG